MTGTRTSLEALRRRLQHDGLFTASHQTSLLIVDVLLAIPRIVTQPSLEEAQSAVSRAVQTILATTEQIPPWNHFTQQQLHLQKVRDEQLFMMSLDSRIDQRLLETVSS